jgi:2-polyprenyl-6-methoxyphenol hydroxylase-like FAD-dependent oxidoreductase
LARSGLAVLLVEREARFRDRVRGDALFPWGAAELAKLGLADLLPASGARPLPVWQEYDGRTPTEPYAWRADVPSGDVVWGVNHPGLQETLLATAGAAGAVVARPGKALAPYPAGRGFLAVPIETGSERTIVRTRLTVGADGRDSAARRWVGSVPVRDPVHHALGGCLVEGMSLDPDTAHLARFDGGVALVFRHAGARARTYLVCQPGAAAAMRGPGAADALLAACGAAFPEGAFAGARAVGPAAFFPGIDAWSDRLVGEGVVLVGDAAGANDPSQGQGMSLAFRDARELRDLLLAADPGSWQGAIEAFACRRPSWYDPLRAYARWSGPLLTDVGPAADGTRARARRAAEQDPWRLGYGAINALGPEGLPVTEAARRRFLGEEPVDDRPDRAIGVIPDPAGIDRQRRHAVDRRTGLAGRPCRRPAPVHAPTTQRESPSIP